MKAITLWQPWASLIAVGAKKYETRSWATSYRGPIAIHAAAKKPSTLWEFIEGIIDHVRAALGIIDPDELPRGAVIATAELVGCYRIVEVPDYYIEDGIPAGMDSMPYDTPNPGAMGICGIGKTEALFGDWTPGRFAWRLKNVQMLPEPIPAKGKQGLWNWERA